MWIRTVTYKQSRLLFECPLLRPLSHQKSRKWNVVESRCFTESIEGSSSTSTNSSSAVKQEKESLQLKESLSRKASRPTYAAIEISSDGNVKAVRLTIPEILRKSSLHVRDLFSLSLTEVDDEVKGDEENNRVKERLYKMHLDAILPRENEIVVRNFYMLRNPFIYSCWILSLRICTNRVAIVWIH